MKNNKTVSISFESDEVWDGTIHIVGYHTAGENAGEEFDIERESVDDAAREVRKLHRQGAVYKVTGIPEKVLNQKIHGIPRKH